MYDLAQTWKIGLRFVDKHWNVFANLLNYMYCSFVVDFVYSVTSHHFVRPSKFYYTVKQIALRCYRQCSDINFSWHKPPDHNPPFDDGEWSHSWDMILVSKSPFCMCNLWVLLSGFTHVMHMAGINSNAVIRVSRNLNAIFTFSLISKTALYLSTAINSLIVKKLRH